MNGRNKYAVEMAIISGKVAQRNAFHTVEYEAMRVYEGRKDRQSRKTETDGFEVRCCLRLRQADVSCQK